jgi:type IV pilus assembly protein PilE
MVKNKGFSLVEIMIVVTIVAILAAIAYPSYLESVRKTHRNEVKAELMDVAKKLQRYKVANFRYLQTNGTPITLANIGEVAPLIIPRQGAPRYEITLGGVTANTWTLTATPINDTTQQLDGSLSVNHRGEKCWTKGANTCALSDTSNWDGR